MAGCSVCLFGKPIGLWLPNLGFSLEPTPPDANPDPGEGLNGRRPEAALFPASFDSPTVEVMLLPCRTIDSERGASACGYVVTKLGMNLCTT